MPGMKPLVGMNGMGGASDLAEMLRQMGRGRDTVLAHITPEEAQMLMDMGGSGTINPNTGLPEFQEDFDLGAEVYRQQAEDPYFERQEYGAGAEPLYGGQMDMTGFRQPTPFETAMAPQPMPAGLQYDVNIPPATEPVDITAMARREPISISPREFLPPTPEQPGLAQRAEQGLRDIESTLSKYPKLTGALGVGLQGIVGQTFAAKQRDAARRQAQELRALGAPLRAEAEALRRQAAAGQLTPQQASAQEAQRARARQSAASRGATTGTQAQMIENQLARQRSELSQNNLENALRQLNMANKYDEAALIAAMQADAEYANDMRELAESIGSQIMRSSAFEKQPQTQRPQIVTPQQQIANRPLITQEPSERLRRG